MPTSDPEGEIIFEAKKMWGKPCCAPFKEDFKPESNLETCQRSPTKPIHQRAPERASVRRVSGSSPLFCFHLSLIRQKPRVGLRSTQTDARNGKTRQFIAMQNKTENRCLRTKDGRDEKIPVISFKDLNRTSV